MLDKTLIINQLTSLLELEYVTAKKSADESQQLVTQADMKQEGKYDTRRTEAGYLAGALAVRVAQLKRDLERLKSFEFIEATQKVVIGSLVKCEYENLKVLVFISPASGGMTLKIDDYSVQITSPYSPLGDSMLAQESGDYFEVESPKGELEYEIIEVF